MKYIILIFVLFVCVAEGNEDSEVEARGKGKYALLINLATVLAAKVGLFKIFLGIVAVIATIKVFVFMAWALAIFKYVPDPYIYYKTVDYKPNHYNPFDHGQYNYGVRNDVGKDALDFFVNYAVHFFYVAATKLFVLKLIYGALFYVIATKAWHFALWFIHYLKEKKHEHHEYVEDHEPYHGHYGYDHHESYGPYGYDKHGYKKRVYETKPSHGGYGAGSYGSGGPYSSSGSYDSSGPYRSGSSGQFYDADGSYSVKSG